MGYRIFLADCLKGTDGTPDRGFTRRVVQRVPLPSAASQKQATDNKH
jgi:hypothetical protein